MTKSALRKAVGRLLSGPGVMMQAVVIGGGLTTSVQKAFRVAREEGLAGLRYRLAVAARQAGQRLPSERVVLGSCSANEITPCVSVSEFRLRKDVHTIAHPSATTPISKPLVRGIDPQSLHFCGPFLLYSEIGRSATDFPRKTVSPPLTIARVSNATCIPGQIVIVHPKDGIRPKGKPVLLDVSFNASDPHHHHIEQLGQNAYLVKRWATELTYLPGRSLFLDCQHENHFGHFLVDTITMGWGYEFAQQAGLTCDSVLLTGITPQFMFPLLEAIGIPKSKVLPLRKPICCEELLVATKCYLTQGYTSPTAIRTWATVRDRLDRGRGPERIYVSRSTQPSRRLQGEQTVERMFAGRGFTILHPEELSIKDQVTIWANARLVAGTAGSNMFGLAFQRRLERAFIINSPNLIHFSELFLQAGHRSETTIYVGKADSADVHGSWWVDFADLEREVDLWLK